MTLSLSSWNNFLLASSPRGEYRRVCNGRPPGWAFDHEMLGVCVYSLPTGTDVFSIQEWLWFWSFDKKRSLSFKKTCRMFPFRVKSIISSSLCASQRHNVVDYIKAGHTSPRPKKQRNILHHLGEAYGTPPVKTHGRPAPSCLALYFFFLS